MMKTIARREAIAKVWSIGVSPGELKPKLCLVIPMREDGPISKAMLHADKNLNRSLEGIETSYDYKSIFPESHSFANLVLLTLVREDEEGTFSFNELNELAKGELNYLPTKE